MLGELRRRWDTPEGVVLAGEVLGRLKAGQPLAGLGLGEVGGRVDLRGFPAPHPRPIALETAAVTRLRNSARCSLLSGCRSIWIIGMSQATPPCSARRRRASSSARPARSTPPSPGTYSGEGSPAS